jgi:hypothetical protein
VTAVLIPIQIAMFIAYLYPKTVDGWYMLLHDKHLVARRFDGWQLGI